MVHQYLKNVATLRLSAEKCSGCGTCETVCPHRVFAMRGDKADITRLNRCMECGACALNCPASAIDVSSGVGCAIAIIKGWLTGTEPSCGCSNGDCCPGT